MLSLLHILDIDDAKQTDRQYECMSGDCRLQCSAKLAPDIAADLLYSLIP